MAVKLEMGDEAADGLHTNKASATQWLEKLLEGGTMSLMRKHHFL